VILLLQVLVITITGETQEGSLVCLQCAKPHGQKDPVDGRHGDGVCSCKSSSLYAGQHGVCVMRTEDDGVALKIGVPATIKKAQLAGFTKQVLSMSVFIKTIGQAEQKLQRFDLVPTTLSLLVKNGRQHKISALQHSQHRVGAGKTGRATLKKRLQATKRSKSLPKLSQPCLQETLDKQEQNTSATSTLLDTGIDTNIDASKQELSPVLESTPVAESATVLKSLSEFQSLSIDENPLAHSDPFHNDEDGPMTDGGLATDELCGMATQVELVSCQPLHSDWSLSCCCHSCVLHEISSGIFALGGPAALLDELLLKMELLRKVKILLQLSGPCLGLGYPLSVGSLEGNQLVGPQYSAAQW